MKENIQPVRLAEPKKKGGLVHAMRSNGPHPQVDVYLRGLRSKYRLLYTVLFVKFQGSIYGNSWGGKNINPIWMIQGFFLS